MKDEGTASWYLGVADGCPGGWRITDVTCLHFFLGALFPQGVLIARFSVCGCSHSFIFTEKCARSVPFLSFFLQQFWQQGQVRAGDERLRAKASGEVAGLESLRFGGLFFVTEVQTRATE